MTDVIAIFDIGKTNKKMLLFSENLSLVALQEKVFPEITDDDGFPCDDIEAMTSWIYNSLNRVAKEGKYRIKALNFTTYGATLVYLDENGKRLTPLYNYLKEMPKEVLNNFYERYGGIDEFSRQTASPALGMLNAGLQVLWFKRQKPEVFARVKYILHFPQYLSYLFTGKITSEYTSIGCHTAMWDFDHQQYHRWLTDEQLTLPEPESNLHLQSVILNGEKVQVGSGLHDSSASLIPYLEASESKFILISTGTWSIFMNPFNHKPLTENQLKNDTLSFLSVKQKAVKSSRLFMGHIHQVEAERLAAQYQLPVDSYKTVQADEDIFRDCLSQKLPNNFNEAYHALMLNLLKRSVEKMQLISENSDFECIYITGGFARNPLYTRLLATYFSDKQVYVSQIDNATAFGGALLTSVAMGNTMPPINLGLKQITPFHHLNLYNNESQNT